MNFLRQLDIVDPSKDLKFPVQLIGVGGIGSPTALALAKMGCTDLTCWDGDTLEEHNLPNQIYPEADIGLRKVDSLGGVIKQFTGATIVPRPDKVTAETSLSGVVISGVDSMAARKEIWKTVKYRPTIPLYIDGRMSAETCRILTARPTNMTDIEAYEETLFDDADVPPVRCTERAVIYNVFMVASLITSIVKKYARGQEFPRELIFDLATYSVIVN